MNEITPFDRFPELPGRLRHLGRSQAKIVDIIRLVLRTMALEENGRLASIWCLRNAFNLEFEDALKVGNWVGFPGGSWSDERLEAELAPLIQGGRAVWDPGEGPIDLTE